MNLNPQLHGFHSVPAVIWKINLSVLIAPKWFHLNSTKSTSISLLPRCSHNNTTSFINRINRSPRCWTIVHSCIKQDTYAHAISCDEVVSERQLNWFSKTIYWWSISSPESIFRAVHFCVRHRSHGAGSVMKWANIAECLSTFIVFLAHQANNSNIWSWSEMSFLASRNWASGKIFSNHHLLWFQTWRENLNEKWLRLEKNESGRQISYQTDSDVTGEYNISWRRYGNKTFCFIVSCHGFARPMFD